MLYQRVRDLLEQYAKLANGKLKVEFYNPRAVFRHGRPRRRLRAPGHSAQRIGGEVGYFGMAASNSTDDEQVIPFFNLDREQFLEYDLTKLIYSLSQPNQPKVGLISTLPIGGMPGMPPGMGGMGGGGTPPWAIMQQIKEFFEVVERQLDASTPRTSPRTSACCSWCSRRISAPKPNTPSTSS